MPVWQQQHYTKNDLVKEKMKKKIIVLSLILLIATLLRFYKLGINPPSLSWDEASIGYNAYSIEQTLRDEHGRFLPYDYFSAFGDYKPPLSIYLTAVSLRIFGFSEWAIRFPSAFLGVLSVFLVYLLIEEYRRNNKIESFKDSLSLMGAFSLAVSPWHTILSRQMFEANIATFFIILGVYLILKGLENGRFLVLGILSLVASLYTFNSPRVFVPLLLIGIVIFFYRKLWLQKRWGLISLFAGIVFSLPLIPHILSPLGQLRYKEVNIFSDIKIVEQANLWQKDEGNSFFSKFIHNRRVGYFRLFLARYFDHFNIDYLFFKGDINPKFSTRSTGQFFPIEVVFLIMGIYFLISREKKLGLFLLYWLLVGLVPAAMARETPHALRTEITLPTWQLFSACGLYYSFLLIKKWKYLFITFLCLISGWQFLSYLHNYFVHLPLDYSQDWQYGYKLAAKEIEASQNRYERIYISDKYGRPYIFFLTYQKYMPLKFQKNQNTTIDGFGFYHVNSYDKYIFGPISNQKQIFPNSLLIGPEDEIPSRAKKLKDIYYLNGEKSLVIAEM
jgi:4-amino-4-deoxy-L-arabinose transferase-like glycosyltransferase